MGGIKIPRFFKKIFSNRFRSESFIVLDIGTFSVKALYVEAGKRKPRSPRLRESEAGHREKSAKQVESETSGLSEGGKVVALSNKQHVSGDMHADGSFNVEGITNTCRAALSELKEGMGKGGHFTNKVVLGVGGGFVFGRTLTQTYIRERPQEEIDEGELSNIVQKVQQRNYDQIRKDFKKDTGRSELELHLIGADMPDIKIDGYQVVNPIGFKGKEVSCGLFNSYIPKVYFQILKDIVSSLNLELISIVSQPHSVFGSFHKKDTHQSDFILIDMGGSTTEVSLARKGRLDDVRSIAVGGSSFTKSISWNLKVGFWEAENIKRRFIEKKVSKHVAKKIESTIVRDVELFLNGLAMVLSDLSQVTLLPSSIYIYGGGSSVPLIEKMLKQEQWRGTLSFSANPIIERLTTPAVTPYEGTAENASWVIPFSMADSYLSESRRQDTMIKLLRRSLRLIQG